MGCQQYEYLTYIYNLLISLGACVVYALIQQLFVFGAKKRIQLDIEYIQGCSWQLEQALSFGDYRTAVEQADNIEKSIIHIYDNMRFYTYGTSKKRRLFNTFAYNVFRFMDQVKFIAIGYNDNEEYKTRCNKLYNYLGNPKAIAYRNWLQDSIYMMSLLNSTMGIYKSIRLYKRGNNHVSLFDIIDKSAFKNDNSNSALGEDLMTRAEYLDCIK